MKKNLEKIPVHSPDPKDSKKVLNVGPPKVLYTLSYEHYLVCPDCSSDVKWCTISDVHVLECTITLYNTIRYTTNLTLYE